MIYYIKKFLLAEMLSFMNQAFHMLLHLLFSLTLFYLFPYLTHLLHILQLFPPHLPLSLPPLFLHHPLRILLLMFLHLIYPLHHLYQFNVSVPDPRNHLFTLMITFVVSQFIILVFLIFPLTMLLLFLMSLKSKNLGPTNRLLRILDESLLCRVNLRP